MKKKFSIPMLAGIFKKLASKVGATVVVEPKWGVVGQIIFKNGRKRYFRGSTIDLNPIGSSDIAKDKDYANFFMKRMGYPTVPWQTFFSAGHAKTIGSSHNIDAAYRYAAALGFPVIVKPNSGSQGAGVAKVYTKRDFYRAMRFIFARDRVALVQTPVAGRDYRVVVLDQKIISAYERIPLSVVGDGRSTIRQLLTKKQRQFAAGGRDTIIKPKDPRIARKLERQGLTMHSVPVRGEHVYLLDNANLSTGGDAVDVTGSIHPEFKKIAIHLT